MKSHFLVALTLFISFAASAQEDMRFRGMEWGASSKATEALKLVEDSEGLKCYAKNGEKLLVGDASLQRIRYCYYKDQLGFVMIDYKGDSNQIILKDVFDKKFGNPYQPNQFMETYWWHIEEEVAVHMEYSEISKNGTIIYRYKPVSDLMSQDQSNSNRDATKDL